MAGSSDYEVFSSTTPNFEPSFDTLIADGLPNPYFEDDSVTAGTTYYYQVYTVDASGTSSLVGTAAATTPSSSDSYGTPATPTNVQAVGINDLELFVSWTQPSLQYVTQYDVFISTNPASSGSWSLAAVVEPGGGSIGTLENCIVRTTNILGNYGNTGQLLQAGIGYYVKVEAVNAPPGINLVDTSNDSQPSTAAYTVPPSFDNVIIVVGGNQQPLPYLLDGLQVVNGAIVGTNGIQGNSVGNIWFNLIEDGFNAFISADPHDGGDGNLGRSKAGESSAPSGVEPVLLPSGDGLLHTETVSAETQRFAAQYQDLTQEFDGIVDYGFVGYSHGGGMIENIANFLYNDIYSFDANVPIGVTIDAVEYDTYYDANPVSDDDNYLLQDWNAACLNYYEPNGYTSLFGQAIIHGEALTGATNNPHIPFINYNAFNHSTIALSAPILNDALSRIEQAFPAF